LVVYLWSSLIDSDPLIQILFWLCHFSNSILSEGVATWLYHFSNSILSEGVATLGLLEILFWLFYFSTSI
jgi:hypothetical protein